jgi:hypothetical protein
MNTAASNNKTVGAKFVEMPMLYNIMGNIVFNSWQNGTLSF